MTDAASQPLRESSTMLRLKPYCRNLIKKPWAFILVPYMESYHLGIIGPGLLILVIKAPVRNPLQ